MQNKHSASGTTPSLTDGGGKSFTPASPTATIFREDPPIDWDRLRKNHYEGKEDYERWLRTWGLR